jgi:hypothetical protein
MTNKLKGLGLALIAMLAFGALSASGAQANNNAALTLSESPATITGEDEEPGVLTRDGRSVTCTHSTYHGDGVNKDTHIVLTPSYTGCTTAVAGSVATVTNTGCVYSFTLTGEKVGSEHTFDATTDLKCGHTGHIVIDVWLSKHNHETNATPNCSYTFSDTHEGKTVNQSLKGVDLTNEPADPPETDVNFITAHVGVEGIVSTRTHGTTLLCGKATDAAGKLTALVKLKAEDELGNEVGATISTHNA